MENTNLRFYKIELNPHQAGDYGGTAYGRTLILELKEPTPLNLLNSSTLPILINKYLKIPYFKRFTWLYEDSNDEDWKQNIKVTNFSYDEEYKKWKNDKEVYKELLSFIDNYNRYHKDNFIYKLFIPDKYYITFPEGFRFEEQSTIAYHNYISSLLLEEENRIKKNEQETNIRNLKKFLKDMSKKELIELLLGDDK